MAVSICNVQKDESQREMTLHGRTDFPVACYEDNMQIVEVPVHWHDEYEYILSVHGTLFLNIGGENLILKEGEAVFINSGCLHSVKNTMKESILQSLVISSKIISGTTDCCFWNTLIYPFSRPNAPSYIVLNKHLDWEAEIAQAMLRAWHAVTKEIYDYENEARFFISRAMRILVDHLPQVYAVYAAKEMMMNRIKCMISYIEKNYMNDISNHDLMTLCGCSESVLLRSFQQVIGSSPMQYVLNYRISKAAELLLTTSDKSCEIANACGFRDVSYFTKTFKKKKGVSPIEYRKRLF